MLAYTADKSKLLVKSVCEIVLESLFWVSTCVPGYLKKAVVNLRFANLVEGKFEMHFW